MKSATICAVMLAALSSFPLIAKQQDPAPQPQQQQSTPATQPAQQPDQNTQQPNQSNGAAQSPEAPATATPANVDLRPVKAELEKKLDSTSVKAGDSVVMKTKESVKIADGTEIPKGSKLVGHVTNVQTRGEGKENSQLGIQFDRAELKGGQSVAILSVIQSVDPAESGAGPDTTPVQFGGAQGNVPSGGASAARSVPAGGGSTPGMNNGASSRSTEPTTTVPSQPTDQAGSTGGSSMGGSNSPAGKIVTTRGNVAIRTTAIPGVLLANSVNGQPFSNASGLLLGAKQDVKLAGGTQITLAVAVAPAGHGSGQQGNGSGNGSASPNE